MPKLRKLEEPTPELRRLELLGKESLREYCMAQRGRMLALADASGLAPSEISRMANREKYSVTLEAAMLIDIATAGKLSAESLCPSRAGLLGQFLLARATNTAKTA